MPKPQVFRYIFADCYVVATEGINNDEDHSEMERVIQATAPKWEGLVSYYNGIYDNTGIVECADIQGTPYIQVTNLLDLYYVLLMYVSDQQAGPLLSSAVFDVYRRNDRFKKASMMMLDFDAGWDGEKEVDTPSIFSVTRLIPGAAFYGYSSFNNGRVKFKKDPVSREYSLDEHGHKIVDKPARSRYRVIYFFNRPIETIEEWGILFRHLEERAKYLGMRVDPSTRNPSRIMFSPRITPTPLDAAYERNCPWEPTNGYMLYHPGGLLDLEALPAAGEGDHTVSLSQLVADVKKKEEDRKKKDKVARELHRTRIGTGVGMGGSTLRRATAILEDGLVQLANGGVDDLGRNTSVFYLGAQCARLAHYLKDEFVEAYQDRVFEAAQAAGLPDGDLERQYVGGWNQGCKDGPKYLREEAARLPSYWLYRRQFDK